MAKQTEKEIKMSWKRRAALRLEKLKLWARRHYNTENNLLLVAVVICGMFLSGTISALSKNWELAKKLEAQKRKKAVLELEVETLELENQFYRSEEYQELAARRQQNKVLKGEKVVFLPENSAAVKNKYKPAVKIEQEEPSNLEQWLMFLLGTKS